VLAARAGVGGCADGKAKFEVRGAKFEVKILNSPSHVELRLSPSAIRHPPSAISAAAIHIPRQRRRGEIESSDAAG
jgi:hypothetical protein